jgi:NADH:ubiquinone oxidoreductase subunit 6 (subunit J)
MMGGDMPSTEEGRENGSALMVMGWVCVLFAFIVMFFNPAALKRGQIGIELIAGALAVGGLLMNLVGSRIRARNRF